MRRDSAERDADQGLGRLGLDATSDRSPGSPFAHLCQHWYGEGHCLAEAIANGRCEVHRVKKAEAAEAAKPAASAAVPRQATEPENPPDSSTGRADRGRKRGPSKGVPEGMRRYHQRRREEKAAKPAPEEKLVQFGAARPAPLARAGDPIRCMPIRSRPRSGSCSTS